MLLQPIMFWSLALLGAEKAASQNSSAKSIYAKAVALSRLTSRTNTRSTVQVRTRTAGRSVKQ